VIRPRARTDGLVLEELDGELLVYDTERDRAHCLNATAARVLRACDGARTPAELARDLALDGGVVGLALAQLADARLLDGAPARRRRPTRRQLLVSAAALPLVLSISAPAAAQAASCVPFFQPCSPTGAPCCGGGRCIFIPAFGFRCV
jgi:hypothetical protein